MFTLCLLLSAATGVNAILGGQVSAVRISEKSFICAENCVYEGVYFAQGGYWCPEKETIVRVNAKGNVDRYSPSRFDCTGATLPTGYSERQRSDGEQPPKCDIASELSSCTETKINDSQAGKTVQWSDVQKELKSAPSESGECTPEESQAAAPKSQQQCEEIGRQIFFGCQQKSGDRDECFEQSREAFKNSLGLP